MYSRSDLRARASREGGGLAEGGYYFMRRAAKRDANEEELIQAAERLGAWVISISQPVDLIVCHQGRLMFVEVKGPKGKYTPAQKSFMAYCEVNKAPFYTWRTFEDVLKCLGAESIAP